MRILITNNTLAARAGTELYVRDIAMRLAELGHEPVCFSLEQGSVAGELREAGLAVVSSLARAHGPFDLIHGHHHIETMLAALAFPRTPVLSLCHSPSRKVWQETPSFLPNIVQYAAVDEACRERLVEAGIPREDIPLLLTFVDTRRFRPRAPLPPEPRRALVFSNYAHDSTHVPAIREACERLGIKVDLAGLSSGQVADRPEELLPRYDLVFAKARAAAEAMAVGCAVILCDFFGAGPMVTSDRLDELRLKNFGFEVMRQPLSAEYLTGQILRYDPGDAAKVSHGIRTIASLDALIPELVALYERVAAMPVPEFDPWEAGADFIGEHMRQAKDARNRLAPAEKTIEELRAEIERVMHSLRDTEQVLAKVRGGAARQKEQKAALLDKNRELRAKIGDLRQAIATLNRKKRPWWKKWMAP